MINILICDDSEIFTEGLSLALCEDNKKISVDVCKKLDELHKLIKKYKYDLLLLNVTSLDDFSFLSQICSENSVLLIKDKPEPSDYITSIDFGAVGLIAKNIPIEKFIHAISIILSGGIYVPPSLNEEFKDETKEIQRDILTPRQMQVLSLMAQGNPNKIIARELNLTEGTVKLHVNAIFKALDTTNRTKAVICAKKLGLI
ncbi:MAG: response regulator transcription factor [Alphaproteobacteria bacterium]|nr:response regulator transcription factor [Alphaproteobacteria bacterium]